MADAVVLLGTRGNLRFIDQPQITGLDHPSEQFLPQFIHDIAESGIIRQVMYLFRVLFDIV